MLLKIEKKEATILHCDKELLPLALRSKNAA